MIHMIVNPVSGNGKAAAAADVVKKKLDESGSETTVYNTEYPGHAIEIAKSCLQTKPEMILSVGGDGTLSEVAEAMTGSGCPLGIIPGGTGNDFIKAIGIPDDPLKSLEIVMNGRAEYIDVGRINSRGFINVCGIGFDVTVLEEAAKMRKYIKGNLSYIIGLIRAVFRYKPVNVRVTVDGRVAADGNVLICAVANGQFIGGGMPIAPEADVSDGLFDVVIISHMSRLGILRAVPAFLEGRITKQSYVTFLRGKKITIESEDMMMDEDGEILPVEYAEFELLEKALLVFKE